MKKCSASLIIRKMKIKITVRYYYTLIRIAKLKHMYTIDHTEYCQGCKGIKTPIHCW